LSTGNGDRDQQRDVAFERAFTAIAAVAVGGNPTAIGALAEQRAPLRVRGHQARVISENAGATDRLGRSRSPVTLPGYHRGRPPANKGAKLGPTPPTARRSSGCSASATRRPTANGCAP
jgi:hypothetical protein